MHPLRQKVAKPNQLIVDVGPRGFRLTALPPPLANKLPRANAPDNPKTAQDAEGCGGVEGGHQLLDQHVEHHGCGHGGHVGKGQQRHLARLTQLHLGVACVCAMW
jgi:hypothetical protein